MFPGIGFLTGSNILLEHKSGKNSNTLVGKAEF